MNNLSVGLFNPNLDSFTQLNVSIRLAEYPESWDSTKAKFLLVGNYHCKSFVHIWAGLLLSEWGENTRVTYHEEYGPGPLYSLVRHLHHEEIGEDKQYHLATLHLKRLVNHGHRTKTNLSLTTHQNPNFFPDTKIYTLLVRGLFCISFSDKSLPTINHGKYPGKKTPWIITRKNRPTEAQSAFFGELLTIPIIMKVELPIRGSRKSCRMCLLLCRLFRFICICTDKWTE